LKSFSQRCQSREGQSNGAKQGDVEVGVWLGFSQNAGAEGAYFALRHLRCKQATHDGQLFWREINHCVLEVM
jgi:hypothetical protein